MYTIRDLIIHPFEIDVDSRNFTLVEVGVTEAGVVAGKKVEGGVKTRKVVGYYNTLLACLNRVARERVIGYTPELDGHIVSLSQHLAQEKAERELFIKWIKLIAPPAPILEEEVPVISPKAFLKSKGESIKEVELGSNEEFE